MCAIFISVCKMVTLGQIKSLTLTPVHYKIITQQAVNIGNVPLFQRCAWIIKTTLLIRSEECVLGVKSVS